MIEEMPHWPLGGGEMARRIRTHDWAKTGFGPIEGWPDRLRYAVELMLSTPYPAVVSWGHDLLQIYNDQTIAIYGHRHPAALGRSMLENFSEAAGPLGTARDQLFATGETFTYTDRPFTLPGPDRKPVTRWFTGGWTPIRDEDGRILGVHGSGIETSGHVLTEAARRQSEERHQLAMIAVEAMVFDWDVTSGRVVRSEGLHRLLGHGPDEAVQDTDWWNERVHPEDRARLGWQAQEAMAAGAPRFEARIRVRHRDGHWVDVLDTGIILYDTDGNPRRVVGSSVDVTARVQAETALRDSEQRLQRVLETDAVAVLFFSRDGILTDANDLFLRTTGYSRRDVQSGQLTWQMMTPPDWHAASQAQMDQLLVEGRLGPYEKEYLRKDGTRTWMLFAGRDLGDGTIVELGVTIDDRRQAEAALRASEARFRAFVTASSDVVYRMNADWSEMRQLQGRTFLRNTDEPNQGWVNRYIHAEDQLMVHARIEQAIRTRSMFEMEHQVIRADGSLGWTLSRAVPILNAGGDVEEWLGAASDITAKKEAEAVRAHGEARLRESEERYLGLYNAMDQGFCTMEMAFGPDDQPTDYRFLEVSPSFEAQTGIKDAAGKWMRDIAPDHDELWFVAYGRVALTGEPARFEAGSLPLGRWWSVYAYRIGDPARRTIAVFFSDITGRKRAEEALREGEERLRQFGEASQDVLWVRDAETFQWTYLTPAFELIYGLDRASALRGDNMANWAELVVPEDRERAVGNLRRARDGEWVTFEYRVRRPVDGQVRWLRDTDFPIKDGTGRVVSIGGVGHDITARKEAEAALAAAEQRQRALLEGIPQLVWRSGDDGLWTWSSPQWLDYTGQTQEQSHGWGWLDAVHPGDHDATRRAWDEAQPHGGLDVEYRVRRASDGAWRWHATRSVPLRAAPAPGQFEGRILEWLGTTTDIQDLKHLQSQQEVMVAELQHRTRNLLAVVRNVARRSIPASPGREEYDARLAALGRVQGFLSRSTLYMVSLADLVAAELEATGDGASEKVVIGGPDVELPGEGVQAVALALHELATNAVKYGALAQDAGQMSVTWRVEGGDGGSKRLVIDWRESGVTLPANPPQRRGYGSELITKALPYQLQAETLLEFKADGVWCRIILPASAFTAGKE